MRMFSEKISFKTFLETNYGIGYLQIFLENTFNNPYPLFLFLQSYSVFLSWIPNPIFISCMPILCSLYCIPYPVFFILYFYPIFTLYCISYPILSSCILPILYSVFKRNILLDTKQKPIYDGAFQSVDVEFQFEDWKYSEIRWYSDVFWDTMVFRFILRCDGI